METLWHDERKQRLETLYRDGLSFALIAADIGVTRSAAIGKAHRMNLPKRIELSLSKPRPPAKTPPRKHRVEPVREEVFERPVIMVPERDYSCTIYELNDNSCRFPLWATTDPAHLRRYCGCPDASISAGIPYCRRHAPFAGRGHQAPKYT